MKIAICLSGLVRTFNHCYPTILENLINSNPQFDFDIIGTFSKKENNEDTSQLNLNLFKVISFEIDPPLPDLSYQESKFMDLCYKRNYYQLLSLKQVNNLRKKAEEESNIKYDLIIRLRTDFKFLSPLYLDKINYNCIYIPYEHDHRGGYNDRFAIGPRDLMDHYLNRYDFWMERHDEIPYYSTHAELNLKIYLDTFNIPVHRLPFNYCLRRENSDEAIVIL
jgi:hypothetical protein